MTRNVVVSNRVGTPGRAAPEGGGLVSAVQAALVREGGLWFGWSGRLTAEVPGPPRAVRSGKVRYVTVDLQQEQFEGFYNGYANGTLWPICHYRLGLMDLKRSDWLAYEAVNEGFAAQLVPELRPDDRIWVHDYQLILVGRALRNRGVETPIGFFFHIPFPALEVFLALPQHRALIEGLLAYDLVGFQIERDRIAFHDYIRRELGGRVDEDGSVVAFGRRTAVSVFPISIETEDYARLAAAAIKEEPTRRLAASLGRRSLVLGVDRLDYSKGIPNRLEALGMLLETHPEHRREIVSLQICPVSRGDIDRYRELRENLEALAGRINGRYSEPDWAPIRYTNQGQPPRTLAGYCRLADVGLVTPLRDGMNLVAKEYVAAQDPEDPGVLVLSRFAGAAAELSGALLVNPYDIDAMADAIDRALKMPLLERKLRYADNMAVLSKTTVSSWWRDFLAALADAGERRAGAGWEEDRGE
ncbi:MAG: trehalose-6-phosphate synthase [Geminicoccaceae bacterium]